MHLHLEKNQNNTILQYLFYKQWSSKYIQNPINFPGFSCFLFHDEIFFVSNLRPSNKYTYIVVFFLNFLNLIYNNQVLLENHTLTSYKWHSDTIIACEKWHY